MAAPLPYITFPDDIDAQLGFSSSTEPMPAGLLYSEEEVSPPDSNTSRYNLCFSALRGEIPLYVCDPYLLKHDSLSTVYVLMSPGPIGVGSEVRSAINPKDLSGLVSDYSSDTTSDIASDTDSRDATPALTRDESPRSPSPVFTKERVGASPFRLHTPPSSRQVYHLSDTESESDLDEEYVPTPSNPRKRQATSCAPPRPRPHTSALAGPRSRTGSGPTRTSCSLTSSTRTPIPAGRGSVQRACLQGPLPRNMQFDEVRERDPKHPHRCPYCLLRWHNDRITDLERHMNSHIAQLTEKWVCTGVPVEDADEWGLTKEDAYEYKGKMFVGGCLGRISRRDAMRRHLNVPHKGKQCVGDLDKYEEKMRVFEKK